MRPDRLQATSTTLGRIASEPMTWLPFVPIAAAYAFVGAPWWICVPAASAIGTGVIAWWKRRWGYLFDRVRVENLQAWLARENAELEAAVLQLSGRVDWRWLAKLRQDNTESISAESIFAALARKRLIEAKILEDGILTADEEELSRVLSDLFAGIRQELERLAAPILSRDAQRETDTRQALSAIAAACRTLHEASETVEQLVDPLAELTDSALPRAARGIQRSTEQLRERMQQSAAIKRRVTESLRPIDESAAHRSKPMDQTM